MGWYKRAVSEVRELPTGAKVFLALEAVTILILSAIVMLAR